MRICTEKIGFGWRGYQVKSNYCTGALIVSPSSLPLPGKWVGEPSSLPLLGKQLTLPPSSALHFTRPLQSAGTSACARPQTRRRSRSGSSCRSNSRSRRKRARTSPLATLRRGPPSVCRRGCCSYPRTPPRKPWKPRANTAEMANFATNRSVDCASSSRLCSQPAPPLPAVATRPKTPASGRRGARATRARAAAARLKQLAAAAHWPGIRSGPPGHTPTLAAPGTGKA